VATALALRDLPMLFLPPMPGRVADRGVALENAWRRDNPALRTTFASLGKGEADGWRPSIVFTPTIAEDGRRLVISNLDLAFLDVNRGSALRADGDARYSLPAVELLKVLPEGARDKLSLAGAARMSASFPWVTPAAELPTKERRHVIDAGYWDNYGVATAVRWIEQHFDDIATKTSGVVLVQIRDLPQEQANRTINRGKGNLALNGYSELVAPVIGALEARESIMVFRNDHDVQQVSDAFRHCSSQPDFFTTIVLESPKREVPLSWALTRREADELLHHFAANTDEAKRVEQLKTWWQNRAALTPQEAARCKPDTVLQAAAIPASSSTAPRR
jgi:hypothetical protein